MILVSIDALKIEPEQGGALPRQCPLCLEVYVLDDLRQCESCGADLGAPPDEQVPRPISFPPGDLPPVETSAPSPSSKTSAPSPSSRPPLAAQQEPGPVELARPERKPLLEIGGGRPAQASRGTGAGLSTETARLAAAPLAAGAASRPALGCAIHGQAAIAQCLKCERSLCPGCRRFRVNGRTWCEECTSPYLGDLDLSRRKGLWGFTVLAAKLGAPLALCPLLWWVFDTLATRGAAIAAVLMLWAMIFLWQKRADGLQIEEITRGP